MQRIARYRYQVFVEQLDWPLACSNGVELDQFDQLDTLYVAAHVSGKLAGIARLLPTTRPYLLGEVFPQLLGGDAPPASARVWELSRFAATPPEGVQSGNAFGHMSSALAVQLLAETLTAAANRGAAHLITVSPLGVERLLRKAGFTARRVGVPHISGRDCLIACWIDTPAAVSLRPNYAGQFELA
ncbi:N-acylhomoserine lactone synthase [Cupriavidus sp. LEh25]|nr:acyl-homoserine-lactone synthase [Cupriavidus sp. LEh25]MBP0624085.1 N-acylhomoserine lactone synthase [Cupriavidus sp. LEh25]